jgi:tRNA modification GTPase
LVYKVPQALFRGTIYILGMLYSSENETICALATAVGGALSVIRLSGAVSLGVACRLWRGRGVLGVENARRLLLGELRDLSGSLIDVSCLAVYMPGPHSYTGEDVVEFHLHGGPIPARLALEAIQSCGVRSAEPGEFTRRAFLNGRLDLTQAEAVEQMVDAESRQALSLANRQLAGELRQVVEGYYQELELLLSEVESRLDFPEEELDWMSTEELLGRLDARKNALLELASTRREGEILRDGARLVLSGAPNAGKSSLLNRLLGRERAIVSPTPGTTRDTVEADFVLRGIPLHLVDTAGIRGEGAGAVELDGMARAKASAAEADLVIWLVDSSDPAPMRWPGWEHRGVVLEVFSKCDLSPAPAGALGISSRTGEGLEALSAEIEKRLLGSPAGSGSLLAVSARHAALLEESVRALDECRPLLESREWELAAIPLRQAIAALGRITGKTPDPDVLDTIFHRFCIGK